MRLVTGLRHVLDETAEVRVPAEQLRVAAVEAIADLTRRYGENELRRSSVLRGHVDAIATQLGYAEEVLELPLSKSVADTHRRARARAVPSRQTTFFTEHRVGLMAVWARDSRGWWLDRYREKYDKEPPRDLWMINPATAAGGQIRPGQHALFGPDDHHAFFVEMEARYRAEAGLPAKGEGWISQAFLARCVETALPGHDVVREASPDWLAPQRLDIFVPSLCLAIEYQGEQHFYSLDHWGGDRGLADRQVMDARKREACRAAGVTLLEWRYDEPISDEAVMRTLASITEVVNRLPEPP